MRRRPLPLPTKQGRSRRDVPAINRIDILNRARQILEEHRNEFVDPMVLVAGRSLHMAEAEVRATINGV